MCDSIRTLPNYMTSLAMIDGHGDDIHHYPHIRINFSSNVYHHFEHTGLFAYLSSRLDTIKNYPEPTPQRAEKAIANAIGLQPEQVMLTNGATEGIYLISQTFHRCLSAILIPTFSEYADACYLHEHSVTSINNLTDIPATAQMVWLCNPNNPTGMVYDKEQLLQIIIQHPDMLFVIDASYAPFTHEPLITPTEAVNLPNVIMLHSMTKEFAIPGIRLGSITANTQLLNRIRQQQMPWSVGTLAQEACCYLMMHQADYHIPLDLLLQERKRMGKALEGTGAIKVYPSHTHILLCQLCNGKASDLKERLAYQHGILIRDASNFKGLDDRHFRIAIQTPIENNQLLTAITIILSD